MHCMSFKNLEGNKIWKRGLKKHFLLSRMSAHSRSTPSCHLWHVKMRLAKVFMKFEQATQTHSSPQSRISKV